MSLVNPTVDDFKSLFRRDFPYGNDDLTTVNDIDINNALSFQQNTINQNLFPTQNLYTQGALLLAAHYLVTNLRASSQGIAGKYDWLTASKSVGPVSAGFSIPERILENPELAVLAGTTYGVQYLAIILPLLTGQMFAVAGGTVGPVNGIFSGPYGRVGPWGEGSPCA